MSIIITHEYFRYFTLDRLIQHALSEGEVVTDGKVTCGLIEGQWVAGKLDNKGQFFSHGGQAALYRKKAAKLNKIPRRTAAQEALLTHSRKRVNFNDWQSGNERRVGLWEI
jgi:hypothetical protein